MRSIVCFLLLTMTAASAETAYHAIALEGGGHIVLRHGDAARVDFVKGDAAHTAIRVADGKLIVENCRRDCPDGYEMELAVTAPEIAALSVRDGGAIEVQGGFPEQQTLSVSVSEGGLIDVRAMPAREIAASVNQGGNIYAAPRASLAAAVSHGGHIAYWGGAKIRQSVCDGGVIARGRAADARKPFQELRPKLPVIPALPNIDGVH